MSLTTTPRSMVVLAKSPTGFGGSALSHRRNDDGQAGMNATSNKVRFNMMGSPR